MSLGSKVIVKSRNPEVTTLGEYMHVPFLTRYLSTTQSPAHVGRLLPQRESRRGCETVCVGSTRGQTTALMNPLERSWKRDSGSAVFI